MQIQLFTIPITDNGSALEEMNRFLRGHKVLETDKHLVQNEHGATWCFCISYIANGNTATKGKKEKVDYKNVLDPKIFEIFSELRKIRKQIAETDAIPAYAVFTDEELAGIAKLKELTVSNLRKIKGIGPKKVEKYGDRIISTYNEAGR